MSTDTQEWTVEYVLQIVEKTNSVSRLDWYKAIVAAHNAALAAERETGDESCREWEKRYQELERKCEDLSVSGISACGSLMRELDTERERNKTLVEACEGLLQFIREKYPDDFKEGGRGFICPHHIEIADALAKAKEGK
jgi:hypothetical protein